MWSSVFVKKVPFELKADRATDILTDRGTISNFLNGDTLKIWDRRPKKIVFVLTAVL
jgi:hypothetical protein